MISCHGVNGFPPRGSGEVKTNTADLHSHPIESIIYVPLQVNRFQKIILLMVQYKYLQFFQVSRRFIFPESDPPHKIMRYDVYYSTQLCC